MRLERSKECGSVWEWVKRRVGVSWIVWPSTEKALAETHGVTQPAAKHQNAKGGHPNISVPARPQLQHAVCFTATLERRDDEEENGSSNAEWLFWQPFSMGKRCAQELPGPEASPFSILMDATAKQLPGSHR